MDTSGPVSVSLYPAAGKGPASDDPNPMDSAHRMTYPGSSPVIREGLARVDPASGSFAKGPQFTSTMDYDHARKAGNAADVWKHFCLLAVTARLLEQSERFRYVDTHAGAGRFRLGNGGEWQGGIGRLASRSSTLPDCHDVRNTATGAQSGAAYPGSWRWVLSLARSMGRTLDLCLFDTNPRVIQAIPVSLPGATVEIEQADGYRGALRYASADLVFVDPPYAPGAARDWERVMELSARLEETGICFLIWYPLFLEGGPAPPTGIRRYARFEIDWGSSGGPTRGLRGCGLMACKEAARTLTKSSDELKLLAGMLGGRSAIRCHNP